MAFTERFHTDIISEGTTPDKIPYYKMITESYQAESGTQDELRDKLVKAGRFYQPMKWLSRIALAGGIGYAVAGITGNHLPFPFIPPEAYTTTDQTIAALEISTLSGIVLAMTENRIAKWGSRKNAFQETFHEKLHLIPEKFHPRNLFKRR